MQPAIVCKVSDSVLQLSSKDPRVLIQYGQIWKVASFRLHLWKTVMRSLTDVAEVEADEFKSSVVAAAHVSYHFICRKVLRAANEYPCSLARTA